jgi:hypothetical protein
VTPATQTTGDPSAARAPHASTGGATTGSTGLGAASATTHGPGSCVTLASPATTVPAASSVHVMRTLCVMTVRPGLEAVPAVQAMLGRPARTVRRDTTATAGLSVLSVVVRAMDTVMTVLMEQGRVIALATLLVPGAMSVSSRTMVYGATFRAHVCVTVARAMRGVRAMVAVPATLVTTVNCVSFAKMATTALTVLPVSARRKGSVAMVELETASVCVRRAGTGGRVLSALPDSMDQIARPAQHVCLGSAIRG